MDTIRDAYADWIDNPFAAMLPIGATAILDAPCRAMALSTSIRFAHLVEASDAD